MIEMNVELIRYTPEPDRTCAAAALACHSLKPAEELQEELNERRVRRILKKTISFGHQSVIEHVNFTFVISDVSRVLAHQLIRHRLASYSMQSQRYVKMGSPSYITPPSIAADRAAQEEYDRLMNLSWQTYESLLEKEVPLEDAMFALPNASTTNITLTMNARELAHFFKIRCHKSAQWEIREMAWQMLEQVVKVAPVIFENVREKYNIG